jgi:hypothetical protein
MEKQIRPRVWALRAVVLLLLSFILPISTPSAHATASDENTAIDFGVTSSTSFASSPESSAFILSDTFTIEFWIKPTSLCATACIIFNKENSFEVQLSSGTLQYAINYSNNSSTVTWDWVSAANATLTLNKWQHVAISKTLTGSQANALKVYINGVEKYSGQPYICAPTPTTCDSTKLVTNYTGTPFTLNARSATDTGTFSSFGQFYIDEFRIWSGYRTQAQIQANFMKYISGNSPNLKAYFDFDGITNETITNRAANSSGQNLRIRSGSGANPSIYLSTPLTTVEKVTAVESSIASYESLTVSANLPNTYLYLVIDTETVADTSTIVALNGNLWNSLTVPTANTPTALPATGLKPGTYNLYGFTQAGYGYMITGVSVTDKSRVLLTVAGNATELVVRAAITLTATASGAGKVSFFAFGKRIPDCINKVVNASFVATCNWKPAVKTRMAPTATFVPTDSSFSASTGSTPMLVVGVRTNKR